TARQVADDLLLARHHRGQVVGHSLHPYAVGAKPVRRVVEMLGRIEQGLARDAAHVQAGAAEARVALDARRAQAELRRADRGHVPAGAGAEDAEVERPFASHQTASSIRSGSSSRSFTFTRNVTACCPSITR